MIIIVSQFLCTLSQLINQSWLLGLRANTAQTACKLFAAVPEAEFSQGYLVFTLHLIEMLGPILNT